MFLLLLNQSFVQETAAAWLPPWMEFGIPKKTTTLPPPSTVSILHPHPHRRRREFSCKYLGGEVVWYRIIHSQNLKNTSTRKQTAIHRLAPGLVEVHCCCCSCSCSCSCCCYPLAVFSLSFLWLQFIHCLVRSPATYRKACLNFLSIAHPYIHPPYNRRNTRCAIEEKARDYIEKFIQLRS